MKNFSTLLLVMFMGMFWLFRLVVAVAYEFKLDFSGIVPLDMTMEIIVLFVTILAIILVAKRKLTGALIYLISYGMYFGAYLANTIPSVIGGTAAMSQYLDTLISFIGMVLPIAVLFDLLMDKGRKAHPVDKKTDWFYKNEKFDRQFDERADRNNYKF